MNFIKRAALSVVHNFKTNILLILLFTAVATLVLSGLCIQSATSQQCRSIRRELGAEVDIYPDLSKLNIYYEGDLPLADVTKISKLKHVETSNFILCVYAQPVNFSETSDVLSKAIMKTYTAPIAGVTGSKIYNKFTNGTYSLASGRHIDASDFDKPSIIMEQTQAEQNHLKIGDGITLKMISGKTETFTIVGTYINNDATRTVPSSLIMSYGQLMRFADTNSVGAVNCYLDDPLNTDAFKKEVEGLHLTSVKPSQVDAQDSVYRRLAGPINNMNMVAFIMVLGVIIAGAIILSLILILCLKGRKFEIGVLLSLGEHKAKIISQMALEILIPVIIGFTLSIAGGHLAAQQIGNVMLTNQNKPQSGVTMNCIPSRGQ